MRCSKFRYMMVGMSPTPPPPPDLNRRVAQEIRAELARQGLTYQDLADRLARSQQWVSVRLSPKVANSIPLDLRDVGEISAALQLDPGQLLATASAA